jgi:hypothetical protein
MQVSEGTVLQLVGMLHRYMPQPGDHWKARNNDIAERNPMAMAELIALPLSPGSALGRLVGAGASGHPRLPVHPSLPRWQWPHGTAADPATALSRRLCGGPFRQPGAHLRRVTGELRRNAGGQLPGLARGGTRHRPVARLLLHKEFEERVGALKRGRGAKGDHVRSETLKCQRPFSILEIEEACPGISRDMVRVILRAMKAEGLIAPHGKGRAAKWIKFDPGSQSLLGLSDPVVRGTMQQMGENNDQN